MIIQCLNNDWWRYVVVKAGIYMVSLLKAGIYMVSLLKAGIYMVSLLKVINSTSHTNDIHDVSTWTIGRKVTFYHWV